MLWLVLACDEPRQWESDVEKNLKRKDQLVEWVPHIWQTLFSPWTSERLNKDIIFAKALFCVCYLCQGMNSVRISGQLCVLSLFVTFTRIKVLTYWLIGCQTTHSLNRWSYRLEIVLVLIRSYILTKDLFHSTLNRVKKKLKRDLRPSTAYEVAGII